MKYLIENAGTGFEYDVLAWWAHVAPNISGKVILIGFFSGDTIDYISSYCRELHVIADADYMFESDSTVSNVSFNNAKLHKYDSIIVNATKESLGLSDKLVFNLINESMSDNGCACILEENYFTLRRNIKNIFKAIVNVIYDIRLSRIKGWCKSYRIVKLPTICYEKKPYESHFEGLYSTNKNIFLLKEKAKVFLLNSPVSRLFVNNNIWLISKNNDYAFFYESILSHISRKQKFNKSEYFLSTILYKYGKLIFNYKNGKDISKSFIAILTYDEEAYYQRLNEKNTVEYLGGVDNISYLLPVNYFQHDVFGYKIFSMQESIGVTVDAISPNMEKMTKNICDVLILLSESTVVEVSLNERLKGWLEKLIAGSPDSKDQIIMLEQYLKSKNFIKSVCMHGDAKVENFVLDNDWNVTSAIDWEQSIIHGFPLIDLYYLIVYNYKINHNCSFSDAFHVLSDNKLQTYENELIDSYCEKLKIDNNERSVLIVVFIIHHYSCRFNAQYKNNSDYLDYCKSLIIALNILKGLN